MKITKAVGASIAIALTGTVLAACSAEDPAPSGGNGQADVVRMSMNAAVYEWLPIYLAEERGYFEEENIELQIEPLQGSSASLLPLLARGDLDITPTVAAPALFNSLGEGFDIKLIASIGTPQPEWGEQGYIMVRQEVWDRGELSGPEDLAGATFDGGPAGSPMNLIAREAIAAGGLTFDDLTFTENIAAPGDQLAALQNGAVDFLAITEPTASQVEADGIAHRWLSASEVAPWAQQGMLAVSGAFLEANEDVVVRFLRAYLRGVEDINASGPEWADDVLEVAAEVTGIEADVIRLTGGPEYSTPDGRISLEFLERVYEIWDEAGLLEHEVDVADMVATDVLEKALG